jgi:hypothetical protein
MDRGQLYVEPPSPTIFEFVWKAFIDEDLHFPR